VLAPAGPPAEPPPAVRARAANALATADGATCETRGCGSRAGGPAACSDDAPIDPVASMTGGRPVGAALE